MKPYRAVHGLIGRDPSGRAERVTGSCFRILNSRQRFITAHHCVRGYKASELAILSVFGDDIPVMRIQQHPTADVAILETQAEIPAEYEQFGLTKDDFRLGAQTHCFGMAADFGGQSNITARVIGGIIQRDLVHQDGPYKSHALELSVPIPKGMSGAPAFYADGPGVAIGIALGSVESRIVLHAIEEYEDEKRKESEKLSRVVEYGIVLRLYKIRDWILEGCVPIRVEIGVSRCPCAEQ